VSANAETETKLHNRIKVIYLVMDGVLR